VEQALFVISDDGQRAELARNLQYAPRVRAPRHEVADEVHRVVSNDADGPEQRLELPSAAVNITDDYRPTHAPGS
jgi:hypothetical protein